MQIGKRVAKLREAHGDSLRAAAIRAGVSHTTIARIEKGEVVSSFQSTLRKIAEGYGVRVEYLLMGKDPRPEKDFALIRLPQEERSRLYFLPVRARIRMLLQFLIAEQPGEQGPDQLADQTGLPHERLVALMDGQPVKLSPEEDRLLAEGLARLTGIPRHWFRAQPGADEHAELLPASTVTAFVHLMKKAASVSLQPAVLEMAIDLLIMKDHYQSTASTIDPTDAGRRTS